jgi:hypothetical protein
VNVTVEREGTVTFCAPFTETGPVVLYLKQIGRRERCYLRAADMGGA